MKVNELKIGNLVYNFEGDICVIHEWSFSNSYKSDLSFYSILKSEPIPLTEEWLLRFGGKLDDLESDCYILSSLIVDYRFHKTTLLDGSFYWVCDKVLGDTCVFYVHQLQNLYFALTGTELTLQP